MTDRQNVSHVPGLWSKRVSTRTLPIERILLVSWVIVLLAIGALIVRDYGVSIDEPNNYRYAADTLEAYPSLFGTLYEPDYDSSYDGHGPAYVTLVTLLVNILQAVFPGVFAPDLWHFSYFLMFQLAGVCLFWLARRWLSAWAAWGVLALFMTQPLLWGHAFINPKDIPFMSLFVASVAAGFAMVDGIAHPASSARPRVEGGISTRNVRTTFWKSIGSQALRGFTNPTVLLAGLLVGLATSVRILGPYAGAIVVLYALSRSVRRTPGFLLSYFIVAALVCYFTWPYLWDNPISKFLQALLTASDYPWQGRVLFEGKVIAATELPARYLPTMMSFQFSEVGIVFFITGTAIAAWKALKDRIVEPLALLLVWFLVPLAAIILSKSVVYDGFRQLFFLVPPLFICAGFTFDWIFKRIKATALRFVILILIIAPGAGSIVTLHPYQYIYYNSLAGGVEGAYEEYELDYWATSYREAALFVNEIAPPDSNVVIFGPLETYLPYARPDIRLYDKDDARKRMLEQNLVLDYAVIFNRRRVLQFNCKNIEPLMTVERDGAVLVAVKEIPPGQDDCP